MAVLKCHFSHFYFQAHIRRVYQIFAEMVLSAAVIMSLWLHLLYTMSLFMTVFDLLASWVGSVSMVKSSNKVSPSHQAERICVIRDVSPFFFSTLSYSSSVNRKVCIGILQTVMQIREILVKRFIGDLVYNWIITIFSKRSRYIFAHTHFYICLYMKWKCGWCNG